MSLSKRKPRPSGVCLQFLRESHARAKRFRRWAQDCRAMALARLRTSNPLLPEPFSTLPLSTDARSALHVFAATFAVIKRLAPFVISQLALLCPQPASVRAATIAAAAIRPVVSITMSNSTCYNNKRDFWHQRRRDAQS
jgi:hypothetical protein